MNEEELQRQFLEEESPDEEDLMKRRNMKTPLSLKERESPPLISLWVRSLITCLISTSLPLLSGTPSDPQLC